MLLGGWRSLWGTSWPAAPSGQGDSSQVGTGVPSQPGVGARQMTGLGGQPWHHYSCGPTLARTGAGASSEHQWDCFKSRYLLILLEFIMAPPMAAAPPQGEARLQVLFPVSWAAMKALEKPLNNQGCPHGSEAAHPKGTGSPETLSFCTGCCRGRVLRVPASTQLCKALVCKGP